MVEFTMAKLGLLIVCMMICITHAYTVKHNLNGKTCNVKEDSMYVAFELECSFTGAGMYEFDGPISIRKITMDRITVDSVLIINSENIQTVKIFDAGFNNPCKHVITPASVKVTVGGILCDHVHETLPDTTSSQKPTSRSTVHTRLPLHKTEDQTRMEQTTVHHQTTDVNSHNFPTSEEPSHTYVPRSPHYVHQETGLPSSKEGNSKSTELPWVVSTITVVTDYIEITIMTLITLALYVQHLYTHLRQLLPAFRNLPPIVNMPQLNNLQPNPHQVPHPNPQNAQINLQHVPLRRSGRLRRQPERLNI